MLRLAHQKDSHFWKHYQIPAFFGVPSSRQIKIGGIYSDHWYDPRTKNWYSGVEGGRQATVGLVEDRGKVRGVLQSV